MEETANIIVPQYYRCYFDGQTEITTRVFDIYETSYGAYYGTVEISKQALIFGVYKVNDGYWRVVY